MKMKSNGRRHTSSDARLNFNIDMKLDKIKYHFVKNTVLITCFFLSTSFIVKKNTAPFFGAETIVSVIQESDGFTISVKTTKDTNIRFYMFTVEGRLVKELNINGTKKVSITQLEKGIYIYDFFSKDERLKSGKIELR
jgi:hypothetical protein